MQLVTIINLPYP